MTIRVKTETAVFCDDLEKRQVLRRLGRGLMTTTFGSERCKVRLSELELSSMAASTSGDELETSVDGQPMPTRRSSGCRKLIASQPMS